VPWTLFALLVLIGLGLWFRRRARRAGVVGVHRSRTGDSDTEVSENGAREAGANQVGINQRSAARLVASTSLVLAAMIATSGTATAAVVLPYTDTNATGGITLCDAHGQTIMRGPVGGSLAAAVVGGSAAVAPFNGDHRSAILTAYQPRKGIDPGNWSGQLLTGASLYTNPKNPMVEILPRDTSLEGFITAYPARWDGLVQLRVYLKAPNQGAKQDTYAATTLKVTGSTWQQVGAVAGDVCKTGTAKSIARILGLPTAAPSVEPSSSRSPGRAAASSSSRPGAKPSTSTPSVHPGRAASSAAQVDSAKANLAGASTANTSGPLAWLLSVGVLATSVMLWWFWNRRRQARLDRS